MRLTVRKKLLGGFAVVLLLAERARTEREVRAALGRLRRGAYSPQTRTASARVDAEYARWLTVSEAGVRAAREGEMAYGSPAQRPWQERLSALEGGLRAYGAAKGERARARLDASGRTLTLGAIVTLVLLGLAVLAGAVIALGLSRDIVGRVSEYGRFAAALARGDLDARVTPRGSDSLTELAHSLNTMAEELEAGHERLAALPLRDPLTGLLNHRAMHDRLAEKLDRAEREGASLALVAFDVDGFKEVNDTLGHAAGDETLRLVAEAVQAAIRSSDVGRAAGATSSWTWARSACPTPSCSSRDASPPTST